MSSERPEVLVIPGRKAENIKRVENPVKVFFMFDNEDFSTVFCGRGNYPRVQDRCQFPGYRSLLLKTVKDQTELAASPESADMIVYAGARADKPMAERVAKARGARTVTLLAQTAARAFYEKNGYVAASERTLYDEGVPHVVMERSLVREE